MERRTKALQWFRKKVLRRKSRNDSENENLDAVEQAEEAFEDVQPFGEVPDFPPQPSTIQPVTSPVVPANRTAETLEDYILREEGRFQDPTPTGPQGYIPTRPLDITGARTEFVVPPSSRPGSIGETLFREPAQRIRGSLQEHLDRQVMQEKREQDWKKLMRRQHLMQAIHDRSELQHQPQVPRPAPVYTEREIEIHPISLTEPSFRRRVPGPNESIHMERRVRKIREAVANALVLSREDFIHGFNQIMSTVARGTSPVSERLYQRLEEIKQEIDKVIDEARRLDSLYTGPQVNYAKVNQFAAEAQSLNFKREELLEEVKLLVECNNLANHLHEAHSWYKRWQPHYRIYIQPLSSAVPRHRLKHDYVALLQEVEQKLQVCRILCLKFLEEHQIILLMLANSPEFDIQEELLEELQEIGEQMEPVKDDLDQMQVVRHREYRHAYTIELLQQLTTIIRYTAKIYELKRTMYIINWQREHRFPQFLIPQATSKEDRKAFRNVEEWDTAVHTMFIRGQARSARVAYQSTPRIDTHVDYIGVPAGGTPVTTFMQREDNERFERLQPTSPPRRWQEPMKHEVQWAKDRDRDSEKAHLSQF